jgi:hypothetical protein
VGLVIDANCYATYFRRVAVGDPVQTNLQYYKVIEYSTVAGIEDHRDLASFPLLNMLSSMKGVR